MLVTNRIEQSVAIPLVVTTLSHLLTEINALWDNVYDICKNDVKNLTITGHALHTDFLEYMILVCSECTVGINSLENIYTELLIAVENRELEAANAREILSEAKNLLQVFVGLQDQSRFIKTRASDCNSNIMNQREELAPSNLVSKVAAQLSGSSRLRSAILLGFAGIAASEFFLESTDSKIILGLSGATFTSVGISSTIEILQSEKFEKLRTIVESLKEKTELLLDYIDELGAEITGVVHNLRAYTTKTENCFALPQNLSDGRIKAKGESLIESTLALRANLVQIRVRAMENSRSIRKVIRLGSTSSITSEETD